MLDRLLPHGRRASASRCAVVRAAQSVSANGEDPPQDTRSSAERSRPGIAKSTMMMLVDRWAARSLRHVVGEAAQDLLGADPVDRTRLWRGEAAVARHRLAS